MKRSNKKIIARNSTFLYLRMFFVLIIGLYISRVLLAELGALDYGIYGVVGSVVTLFSFFNSAMTTAGERCLAFELGKGLNNSFEKMLGAIILSTLLIGLVVFSFLQIGGFYFLEHLNIPQERMSVAKLIFNASCISFLLTTMQVPFTSSLMAQEKINVFSGISVLEIILRLLVVLSIQYINYDKLVAYSYLLILSNLIVLILSIFAGSKNVKISFKLSKYQTNTISKYFGWNLLGGLASVSLHQGLQIILNIFFNPIVNAAQTIAVQIRSGLQSFAANIRSASNPQIVKLGSINREDEMLEILSFSMRFSSIAILIVSVPFYIKIDYILELWLKNPPEYSAIFIKLYIINAIIDVVSSPIVTVIQAIGNIKRYQIIASSLLLSILPLVYLFYSLKLPPYIYGFVLIIITSILVCVRIKFLTNITTLSFKKIAKAVLKQIVLFPTISFLIPFVVGHNVANNLFNLFFFMVISSISVLSSAWFLLFSKKEKNTIFLLIKRKLRLF